MPLPFYSEDLMQIFFKSIFKYPLNAVLKLQTPESDGRLLSGTNKRRMS